MAKGRGGRHLEEFEGGPRDDRRLPEGDDPIVVDPDLRQLLRGTESRPGLRRQGSTGSGSKPDDDSLSYSAIDWRVHRGNSSSRRIEGRGNS